MIFKTRLRKGPCQLVRFVQLVKLHLIIDTYDIQDTFKEGAWSTRTIRATGEIASHYRRL